jgi:hypothetical protein
MNDETGWNKFLKGPLKSQDKIKNVNTKRQKKSIIIIGHFGFSRYFPSTFTTFVIHIRLETIW